MNHNDQDTLGFHVFRYAITRKDGRRYNGNAYGDDRDWHGTPYTYTRHGAEMKIERFPEYFQGCTVTRCD